MRALLLAAALLPGFTHVRTGYAGGSVWTGPMAGVSASPGAVYFPPGFRAGRRYPVVYLLHGLPGGPSEYWDSLDIADVADGIISAGESPPFIAVMPAGGGAEWAGASERGLVDEVVPWVDENLPVDPSARDRALEGLSAGGFGAVDIGLRHPGMFRTLGAWAGYFAPVFRDGPFAHASPGYLAAHTPALLARREARTLRRDGTRFYVSVGGNHGAVLARWSVEFAHEVHELGLRVELWRLPAADRGRFWSSTFPSALAYAGAGFAQ